MLNHHSVNISDVVKDNFWTVDRTITAEDGFQIAFALVANGDFDVEDFYEYNIYRIAHGTHQDERHKFEIHHCDERELMQIRYGFPGAFYPLKPSLLSEFNKLKDSLMCIDNTKITLQGNEDEKSYQNFFVEIDVQPQFCDPHKQYYCEPLETFKKLTQDVGFYTITNQRRFDASAYGEAPLVDESIITYFSDVNSSQKRVQRLLIRLLEDDTNLFMSFPGFSDVWLEYFEIVSYRNYEQHTSYMSKLAIEYELEMDTVKTTRTVYTFLDVLGQTGGIYGILIAVALALTVSLNGKRA